jgi:transcriptional regulator of acetoin/glycerol metabolism
MDGSTVIVSKALAQLSLQRLSLEVLEGPDAGLKHPVEDDKLVIGSHEGADLVLKDDAVSRFHCELRSSGDRVLLVDLDSSNGTRLDGVSVLQAHLRDGSLVELGRTKLKVSFTGDRFELPLGETSRFGQMVGSSAPMRRAFERLSRGAESDATVLLLGETGTGKEAAAESIHEASKRRDGPFVVVDCGAIPGQLLESELFGHLKVSTRSGSSASSFSPSCCACSSDATSRRSAAAATSRWTFASSPQPTAT